MEVDALHIVLKAKGLRRSSCPVLFIGSVCLVQSCVHTHGPCDRKRHGRLRPLALSVFVTLKPETRRSARITIVS